MVGTTWKLKNDGASSLIITVLRLTERRDAWVCVVLYDSDEIYRAGELVEHEEPTLNSMYRRIG
jgi:hypothetical protein